MNATLSFGPNHELLSTLSADNEEIPVGFVAMSALVIAPGINSAFEIWGRFLTDLTGKKRPANDADFTLKYLGYWTGITTDLKKRSDTWARFSACEINFER